MKHSTRIHGPSASAVLAAALVASSIALLAGAQPAHAQSCYTQDGQTICCDNSGRCYRR